MFEYILEIKNCRKAGLYKVVDIFSDQLCQLMKKNSAVFVVCTGNLFILLFQAMEDFSWVDTAIECVEKEHQLINKYTKVCLLCTTFFNYWPWV